VRFYIDLYSTKPIDKASIEAGIRELKLHGWKFFNMRLREDGRRRSSLVISEERLGSTTALGPSSIWILLTSAILVAASMGNTEVAE